MCATCGCSEAAHRPHEDEHDHGHHHEHEHEHDHEHVHDQGHHAHSSRRVLLERDVLEKNDRAAGRNRGAFAARRLLAINLVSAPGAGKTTLLERTVREADLPVCVIEGDQATSRDADRIRAAGARALQINTGAGCHLDAEMIERALPSLEPAPGSLLVIENVGNLVCPALFDLGEHAKVLLASVTEGDDKPLKYPHMFRAASLLLLNKVDLLPHVSFDVSRFAGAAREVNPRLSVLHISAARGDGLQAWYAWLRARSGEVSARSRAAAGADRR
jgi:hydrogenase nickel incorporation protein HypB